MKLLLMLGLAAAQASGFTREEQTEALHFQYSWPAEANALPALRAELVKEMEAAEAMIRESPAEPGSMGSELTTQWESPGRTERLLSLFAESYIFHSGAAHGNVAYQPLLWDRRMDRPVEVTALLGSDLGRFTERHCGELERTRWERWEGPPPEEGEEPNDDCPPIDEQVLAPGDLDSDGRFDTILVLMGHYAAGPYSEGTYVLEIPLEAQDLASIPADYRPDFEIRE